MRRARPPDRTHVAQTLRAARRYRGLVRAHWLNRVGLGHLLAAVAAAIPLLLMALVGKQPVALSGEAHFWPVVIAAGTAAFVAYGLTMAGVRARDGRAILLGTAFSTTTALLAVRQPRRIAPLLVLEASLVVGILDLGAAALALPSLVPNVPQAGSAP